MVISSCAATLGIQISGWIQIFGALCSVSCHCSSPPFSAHFTSPTPTSTAIRHCQVCPTGTACEGAATLDELPLQRGYYRIDDNSTDVRKCPDADANCATNFVTSVESRTVASDTVIITL